MEPTTDQIEGQMSMIPEPDNDKAPSPPRGPGGKFASGGGAAKKTTRKKTSTGRPVGRPKGSTNRPKVNIEAKVSESLSSIGAMIMVAGMTRADPRLQWDGMHVASKAPDVAAAVAAIAEEDPRIKRALEGLFVASSWSKIASVAAGLVIPIAACHGAVPGVLAAAFVEPGMFDPTTQRPSINGTVVPPPAPKQPKPKRQPKPKQQPTPDPTPAEADAEPAPVNYGDDPTGYGLPSAA